MPASVFAESTERSQHKVSFSHEVPGQGIGQARPFREIPESERTIQLPAGHKLFLENGHPLISYESVELNGLDERHRRFELRDGKIYFEWKVANGTVRNKTAKLTLVIQTEITVPAPNPDINQQLEQRYQDIRKRFLERFYFQGMVAAWHDPTTNTLNFGDQNCYQGQALMFLGLEMKYLRARNKEVSETKRLITEILDAIDELDRQANRKYGGDANQLDGFLERDDITGVDDSRLNKRFVIVQSDWQATKEVENDTPSGDQIVNLMAGLGCVVKFSGDEQLINRAKELTNRLFEYCRRSNFVLKKPNGKTATKRGSEVYWYATLLHGMKRNITGINNLKDCKIDVGTDIPLDLVGDFWAKVDTAKVLNTVAAEKFNLKVDLVFKKYEKGFEFNSFALHIVLMLMTYNGGVWSQQQIEEVALKSHHELSPLLFSLLGNKALEKPEFKPASIQQLLLKCPTEGPSQKLEPSTGWSHDNRWIRCSQVYKPHPGNHDYNGLDWLVLYMLVN